MTIKEIRKLSLEYARGERRSGKIGKRQKPRHPLHEYSFRNELLRRLGFESYDAYLKSPLWISVRKQKLLRHPRCYGCNARATQVHHGRYTLANLSGKTDQHLYSVCGRCHRSCEFKKDRKLSPKQATRRLKSFKKGTGLAVFQHFQLDAEYAARIEREE